MGVELDGVEWQRMAEAKGPQHSPVLCEGSRAAYKLSTVGGWWSCLLEQREGGEAQVAIGGAVVAMLMEGVAGSMLLLVWLWGAVGQRSSSDPDTNQIPTQAYHNCILDDNLCIGLRVEYSKSRVVFDVACFPPLCALQLMREYEADPSCWAAPGPTRATAIVACIPTFMDASGHSTGGAAPMQRGASLATTQHVDPAAASIAGGRTDLEAGG